MSFEWFLECRDCGWEGKEEEAKLVDKGETNAVGDDITYRVCPQCRSGVYSTEARLGGT